MIKSMDNEIEATQNLITCLLDAVKKCQTRFGGRTELATDGDSSIGNLCMQFELIFQHGLRKTKTHASRPTLVAGNAVPEKLTSACGGPTLMDVITTFNLNINLGFKTTEPEPAFWKFVCGFLNCHEQERYALLKNVTTDVGKGRAWLRSALNEHSLERYVHMFLADHDQLKLFYEDFSIMRDLEMSSILPNVAAGLGSILFAINIDNEDLNVLTSQLRPVLATPTFLATESPHTEPKPVMPRSTQDTKFKEKRKKRRVPVQIVTFDDNELNSGSLSLHSTCKSAVPTCLPSPADLQNQSFILETPGLANDFKEGKDFQYALPFARTFAQEIDKQAFDRTLLASNSDLEDTSSCEDYQSSDCVVSSWTDDEHSGLNNIDDNTNITKLDTCQRNLGSCHNPVALGGFSCIEISGCWKEDLCDKDLYQGGTIVGQLLRENAGYDNDIQTPLAESRRVSDNTVTDIHTPLTPVTAASIGELFPIQNNDDVHSEDSISIPSFSEDTNSAAIALALAQDVLHSTPNISSSCDHVKECAVSNSSTSVNVDKSNIGKLSNGELSNALLVFMQKHDELDDENKSLRFRLDKEMELCMGLRAKSEEFGKKQDEKLERFQTKLLALNRENELLKHQLRKYVGAVQMLKHDGIEAHEALVNLVSSRENHLVNAEPSTNLNYHFEGQEYERKLIQVAEMHGELMEFNERLQRLVSQKDLIICQLREELVALRGPLPDDALASDDHISITSDYDNLSMTTAVRALINVWIPSVFLTGKSSDVHHVYQVYIRIRDEEWNIYRRYAQFYGFHKFLKKSHHSVTTFEFPPKKVIGNKDAKFVEERRKRLQHYLRCVVNLILQGNSDLASNPDKQTLISLLPFFGDIGCQSRRSVARRTNGFFTRYASHQSEQESGAYTGL